MNKSIELDVAFENPTELITLTQKAKRYGVELEIITESADYNGGWPVIKFTGKSEDLLLLLDEAGYDRDMLVEELG